MIRPGVAGGLLCGPAEKASVASRGVLRAPQVVVVLGERAQLGVGILRCPPTVQTRSPPTSTMAPMLRVGWFVQEPFSCGEHKFGCTGSLLTVLG